MSTWLAALFFSVGASTWIYTKLQRTSGNNTRRSLIATAIAGVLIFVVFYFILNLFL